MESLSHRIGDTTYGQGVQITRGLEPIPVRGAGFSVPSIDFLWLMALEGRIFVTADADQNDTVTTQTSFANTTPSFLLDVPAGTYAIPLFVNLSQTGTVAGGDIDVIVEIDNVKRYASGGTSEKLFSTLQTGSKCAFYTGATAKAGYGITVFRVDLAPDVSPAEGAVQGPFWKPEFPMILRGPASLLVYTYAAVTAPTWFWQAGFIELDQATVDKHLGLPG